MLLRVSGSEEELWTKAHSATSQPVTAIATEVCKTNVIFLVSVLLDEEKLDPVSLPLVKINTAGSGANSGDRPNTALHPG